MIIITANAIKLNLTKLTTRSDYGQLLSVFLSYLLHLCSIPHGCKAFLPVWQEERAFCVECLVVFPLPSPPSTFH